MEESIIKAGNVLCNRYGTRCVVISLTPTNIYNENSNAFKGRWLSSEYPSDLSIDHPWTLCKKYNTPLWRLLNE